jgi:hypothetical protein
MSYVTDQYIYDQTATPSTDGFYKLVIDVLRSSNRSKATLIAGDWVYPADVVKKVLAVPPAQLDVILQSRGG